MRVPSTFPCSYAVVEIVFSDSRGIVTVDRQHVLYVRLVEGKRDEGRVQRVVLEPRLIEPSAVLGSLCGGWTGVEPGASSTDNPVIQKGE